MIKDMSKCLEIISKLKELTNTDTIKWKRIKTTIDVYTKTNSAILEYISEYKKFEYSYSKSSPTIDIDLYESYFVDIINGRVFVMKCINKGEEKYFIVIQPSLDSNLLNLNDEDECQAELLNLIFAIRDQINSPEDFINKIITYRKDEK